MGCVLVVTTLESQSTMDHFLGRKASRTLPGDSPKRAYPDTTNSRRTSYPAPFKMRFRMRAIGVRCN
jgi:hypothetical protein